ncbi:MAG: hypothetical protein NVSMB62_21080 [Acidobacteriaceae bacterium]
MGGGAYGKIRCEPEPDRVGRRLTRRIYSVLSLRQRISQKEQCQPNYEQRKTFTNCARLGRGRNNTILPNLCGGKSLHFGLARAE